MALDRARSLGETWLLARDAGVRAGVTRLADTGGLAGADLPVFQAVRPFARSLTVAQGKGGSILAAKTSALLEAAELASAEALPWPGREVPLDGQPEAVQRCWSGERPQLTIDLEPALPRGWVEGQLLDSGKPMPMPWDLLSLDFTRRPLEFPANSAGLATGNTRCEALLGALCEVVEHDLMARFEDLGAPERLALQIDVGSIAHARLARELRRVSAAGYTPRLWSLGQDHGLPAIACVLFAPEPMLDMMTPAAGSACHPDAATAALAALREAVQGRAALVAGARDDIVPADYTEGRSRAEALAIATLALEDGPLSWASVATHDCSSTAGAVALLKDAIARLTHLPVVVFDHPPPAPGLHLVHVLAPGLRHLSRRRRANAIGARRRAASPVYVGPPKPGRAVLFAGPSIIGLSLPHAVELRPPAVCGDLVGLLADPPAAVGLIDGYFGIAPSVWHKEILALLARGVRVLGAASLGALRAAELSEAGMEGVGAIYAGYRAAVIERDDAVMLLHAPADYGFTPLTVALVDAEHTLAAIACPARDRRMMQRIVRTMSYRERSWSHCLARFRARTGRDFPVDAETLASHSSLKRADAALLIDRLGEAAREGASGKVSPEPPPTGFFLKLLARTPSDAASARARRSPGEPAGAAAAYPRAKR